MAEAKTKPTAESVDAFIGRVADERRRNDCRAVLDLMADVTGEAPVMWGPSIIGFGRYRYRYQSGHEGEWPITGFSPRKQDLTLYITPGFQEWSDLMPRLGKYKTGKSCLYIKKLSDVDMDVLRALVERSVARMAKDRIES